MEEVALPKHMLDAFEELQKIHVSRRTKESIIKELSRIIKDIDKESFLPSIIGMIN